MIVEEEKVEVIEEKKSSNSYKPVVQKDPISVKHISILFSIFFGISILILIVIFGIFSFYNASKNTISQGIYINGINVSGLSKKQAEEIVTEYYDNILSKDIILVHKDYETYIKPSEIKLSFDIKSAVNYAYSIGKNENILKNNYAIFDALLNGINIIPTYTLNTAALKDSLSKLSTELPDAVIESSYYKEGSKLIITKGKDGYIVDINKTSNDIQSKIGNLEFVGNKIEISVTPKSPNKINIDEIHSKIYKKAVNARYTKKPYAVYPSSNGLDFDISLEEAQKLLDKSKKECKIPLKTLYPKVTTNDIGMDAFPDLLATFSTSYYASNTNRTTNLKLAANKINGFVLLPGETFSYNQVVGERTIAAGYKEAATYVDGQVVDGLGGGICQISTTLFNAILFANLNIVELHNHQFVPSYVGAGRDATVVYGAKDFKFSNSRDYAIKITCSVSGGIAKFNIYGVKQNPEYKVNISSKITSRTSSYIKSVTYRTLKSGNKTIKRETIYNCTYKNH
ncbi:MAG: hypothetical protein HFJ17_04275 [Clostridia bacterium]|nr:hypothetical protein [Clostridia bacterium]